MTDTTDPGESTPTDALAFVQAAVSAVVGYLDSILNATESSPEALLKATQSAYAIVSLPGPDTTAPQAAWECGGTAVVVLPTRHGPIISTDELALYPDEARVVAAALLAAADHIDKDPR